MRKSKYTADSGPRPERNTTTATHRGIIIDSLTIACGNNYSMLVFHLNTVLLLVETYNT